MASRDRNLTKNFRPANPPADRPSLPTQRRGRGNFSKPNIMKPKSLPKTRAKSEAKSEENKRAYQKRKSAQGPMTGKTRAAAAIRTLFKPYKMKRPDKDEPRSAMKPLEDAYVPIRAWVDCKQDRDEHAAWLKKHNLK